MRGWLAMGTWALRCSCPRRARSGASIGLVPPQELLPLGRAGLPGRHRLHPPTPGRGRARPQVARADNGRRAGHDRGLLSLGAVRGERKRLLAVTDQANARQLRSAHAPRHGRGGERQAPPWWAGPRRAVHGRGFTDSKRLYAHIRRGRRYRRNVGIGRLKGACRQAEPEEADLLARHPAGRLHVQFDGKRATPRRRGRGSSTGSRSSGDWCIAAP